MGALLVLLLFFVTAIGKKINEPFASKEIEIEKPDVLLDLPLQANPQAQDLNYGALVRYEYRTPINQLPLVSSLLLHTWFMCKLKTML